METANTRAFRSQCESLKAQAQYVIKNLDALDISHIRVENDLSSTRKQSSISATIRDAELQARSLVNSYGVAREAANKLGLSLPEIDTGKKSRAFLRELIIAVDTGIGFVGRDMASVSPEEQDKLTSLENQIKPIEALNPGIYKHLSKAIQEQEATHFLSAAMIAAKVSMYIHEQLEGNNEVKKTKKLVEAGILPAKLEQNFLTGIRLARHYYIHESLEIPEPQESMSILSFSVDLALRYQRTTAA